MKRIKFLSVFTIIIGLTMVSTSTVFAGNKNTYNIAVSTTQFSGSIGTARSSADNLQQIGCWYQDTGTGFCHGRDSTGTSLTCSTNIASLLTSIRSLNNDSYIRVTVNGGRCTSIFVSNSSSISSKL